jgi:thiamine pyrophosphate-dependent acetolactate synthase large subunit-like protein
MNDGGYGAEVHKLGAQGFDPDLARWRSPDFVALAKAFGGDGLLLKSEAELPAALAKGLAAGGLYLIDARISPTTLSDPYEKLILGRESRAPLLRHPARAGASNAL